MAYTAENFYVATVANAEIFYW